MTYGIPHQLIPLTAEGKIKLKNHMDFIKMRRAAEEYAQHGEIETCDLPLASDILLKKGKPYQEFVGNRRLHAIVDEHLLLYHQLTISKQEKTELAAEIVKMVKGASGRFLSKDSGVWIEVSDDIAVEKVSHIFRARRSLTQWGHGSASNGIKVPLATEPNLSPFTNKRVKL
jgi:hypothetical protein